MSDNPPFIVSVLGLAQDAPQRWASQYASWDRGSEHHRIGKKLAALPKSERTPARIAEIIGNDSWSVVECDQCGKRVPVAVTVGQQPDYETSTATICEPCLRRALALLEQENAK